MKRVYSEDPREQEASMQRHFNIRLNMFFFSAFAIFTVIIVRLAILQFVEGPTLSKQESSLRVKDVPLAPTRGTIYAAGGEKLAYSTPVQSLYITLQKDYSNTTDKGKKNRPEALALADKLKEVFDKYGKADSKMTKDAIIEAMDLDYRKQNGFSPRRIKMDLTKEEVAYFLERKDQFPGIDIVEESIRHYDPDTVAVQTIGYIRKYSNASTNLDFYKQIRAQKDAPPDMQYTENEDVGYDGLELYYQSELRGKNGYKSVPIDPRNMATGIPEITPPVKGNDLHTTINKNIQLVAEQAILDQIAWVHTHPVSGEVHPNAKTGYAVAMEVDTGNVVAMASMPDYDTNVWQSGGVSPDAWKKISSNYMNGTITPFSSGRSGHDFESTVLLGSTIKPLSVLLGLNENLFSTDSYYNDTGIAYFGKNNSSSVKNSHRSAYGLIDPRAAIKHSSNTFMVNMVGERLYNKYGAKGIDVWDGYMKQFGLGVSTGVDLPQEYLGKLEYMNDKETALSRLAYASFGQQGKYTTLQLAQYTATLATRGKRMEPHLVSKITDSAGNVVKEFEPKVLNEVKFNNAYWKEVIAGMSTDVNFAFSGFPYDFARKTGTSEQWGAGRNRDNGVFIAFAPRENPKLAVAVVIPEGGFGAYSAAPVARKIFDAYDQEYGLDGVPKKTKNQQTNGQAVESNKAE
ncbi:MAG: penicillin-binding transpeptidase domain-containing protein [Paenibacillus macerans]|uniref:Penicillin binding transpeptidase domain protein n=1 Tax=Paenibacillus macerans TaxID=44252 RepID=A0A091A2U1_PAEMA|nr:penicillin-binding transpeptidase domain-containing protein [Paenibacillus macerans]KFN10581.1 penicillin binding transpeptidase domain protein [Paenibacillus macerans]MBS5909279.1 penicillin-binding protein 2 [Paenibacillus macerans]MCY7556947.1 penicillin-binding protein 2 [Paenibacillus macerans]MDU7477495.1 penicillin-binding transpeptidase domain-containing protein [Paenibacillus macerans]MEC0150000.1 penicillin-binding transpeptidase domain-containing protein [Paenibacillus macerans]